VTGSETLESMRLGVQPIELCLDLIRKGRMVRDHSHREENRPGEERALCYMYLKYRLQRLCHQNLLLMLELRLYSLVEGRYKHAAEALAQPIKYCWMSGAAGTRDP